MSLIVDIHKELKDFSLNIKFETEGEAIGLLGASGCGKSLTLKCIAGIETPDSGRIVLNGRILYDSEKKIIRSPQIRNTGFMFQNYALFPNMTVHKNVEIAIRSKKDKKAAADKLLERFHIDVLRDRYPSQLSGGEQQRVALARIMAYEPEVLMLDEPFSALDSYLKYQLHQELYEVLKEYPGDIILVSHSRDELYRFCQTIAVINQGEISEIGEKENIFHNPADITTARLTGCKNISRAVRVSDYEVYAIDWNVCLKTGRQVKDGLRFVGIRAHNIKAVNNQLFENVLPISISEVSECPFENSIFLNNDNNPSENGRLWWIISKQNWQNQLRIQLPRYITLPKDDILLLKDYTDIIKL